MITAFYSFRLISMTFLTYPNAPKGDYESTHEQPFIVVVPYVILTLLAIVFGYIAKDAFISPGTDMLAASLFIHPSHITLVEAEFSIPLFYKLLPAIGSIVSAVAALVLYHVTPTFTVSLTSSKLGYLMYSFFNGKYFFDVIYNYLIKSALSLGLVTSKVLDRGLIEKLGPFGLSDTLTNASSSADTLQSGTITNYALAIMLGLFTITLALFASQLGLVTDASLSLILLATLVSLLYKSY